MKIILLVGSCVMLVGCPVMAVMQIKEKKRIADPFTLLIVVTFLISLFMLIKLLGV